MSPTNTAAKGWYPIGYGSPYFRGELDENGYTIRNLWSGGGWGISYKGLFSVAMGAVIKNLNIELAEAGITGGYEVGGITGDARNGTLIENCTVKGGKIVATGGGYAGGLAGFSYGSPAVVIKGCAVEGTATKTSGNYSGGLIGVADGATQIVNSKTTGTVSEGVSYVGGLAGALKGKASMASVYSSGAAKATISYAGGLAGVVYNLVDAVHGSGGICSRHGGLGHLV